MPAPSPLAITTSSVQRLLKEEASYHKELADQEKTVKALEAQFNAGATDEDGNEAFMLKQHVSFLFLSALCSVRVRQRLTSFPFAVSKPPSNRQRASLGPLKQRIADAVAKLEDQVAAAEQGGAAPEAEVAQAKAVLAQAKAAAA